MKKKYDDLAQIGLGLMVVYIACILAMVTCGSMIIQQTEKLAQQAQHTINDANKESANKMVILNAWVEDNYDDYLFLIEYQSIGKNVDPADVDWILYCEDDGDFFYRSGTLDSWNSGPGSIWEVGTTPGTVSELESGKRYFFGIDSGTNDAVGGAQCGPSWLEARGTTATFMVIMPDGGVSTQTLLINDLEVGSPVI